RREGEAHLVDAVSPEGDAAASRRETTPFLLAARHESRKRRLEEREVAQMRLHGAAEARRGRLAGRRQLERGAAIGGKGLLRRTFGLFHGAFEIAKLVALVSERRPPRDHLGECRAAIAVELREGVEPFGHERGPRGI